MGPALAAGIQNAVAVDDFMAFVFQERKIVIPRTALLEFLQKFLRIIGAVDAYGEYLCFFLFLFVKKPFQLAELLCAVGSPVAAIEDQHDIFLAAVVR